MLEAIKNNHRQLQGNASQLNSRDLNGQFSEILGALEDGMGSAGSVSSEDTEMLNILADQFSTEIISQATAANVLPRSTQLIVANKEVNQASGEETLTDSTNFEQGFEKLDTKGFEQGSNSPDTQSGQTMRSVPARASVFNNSAPALVQAETSGIAPTKEQVASNSLRLEQNSPGTPETQISEATEAIKNFMTNSTNSGAVVAAPIAKPENVIIPQAMQTLLAGQEHKNLKVSGLSNVESARVEPVLKTKETSQRNDELRGSKIQLKKDFQLAVQKIEEALKEAIAAKDGKSISLKIEQPTLGPIKVDITLKDGSLYARIVVESPQVGNALREKSQEIVENLRKLGLGVDSINVFIGSSMNNHDFSEGFSHQPRANSQSLKVLLNDASNLDTKSLVPGLANNKSLSSGWIA